MQFSFYFEELRLQNPVVQVSYVKAQYPESSPSAQSPSYTIQSFQVNTTVKNTEMWPGRPPRLTAFTQQWSLAASCLPQTSRTATASGGNKDCVGNLRHIICY